MTPAQQTVFDAVRIYIAQHNRAPTVREIGEITGLRSNNTIANHLDRLVSDGLLVRTATHRPRNIALARPLERFSDADLLAEISQRGGLFSMADARPDHIERTPK